MEVVTPGLLNEKLNKVLVIESKVEEYLNRLMEENLGSTRVNARNDRIESLNMMRWKKSLRMNSGKRFRITIIPIGETNIRSKVKASLK